MMKKNQGVFETLRTYQGKPFKLVAHLRRLRASARVLAMTILPTNQTLTKQLQAQCRISGETRLKIVATQGQIKLQAQPLRINKTIYHTGVAVATYQLDRQQPTVKNINRAAEDAAYAQAIKRGYFDALLVSKRNTIPEASRANLFLVKHGTVYTANRHILYGITRAVVIPLAKRRCRVRYLSPTLDDIYQADECFLTRSSTGIVPVVRVNKKTIGDGQPGRYTKQLMQAFDEYTKKNR